MSLNPITREQFEKVREKLEAFRKQTRPRVHDLYDIVGGVLYREVHKTAWRNLPDCFPPWRTVHEYHTLWKNLPYKGKPMLVQVLALLDEGNHGQAD